MAENRSKNAHIPQGGSNWLGREIIGLVAIFLGLLLFLSLATFDPRDPYFNQVISVSKVHNRAGLLGSYAGGFLFDAFGFAAWVVPLYFCLMGTRRILSSPKWPWWRWVGVLLLVLCVSLAGAARDIHIIDVANTLPGVAKAAHHGGGLLGFFLYTSLVSWLSQTGTTLVWICSLLLAVQLLVGFSWVPVVILTARGMWNTCSSMAGDIIEQTQTAKEHSQPGVSDKEKNYLQSRSTSATKKTEVDRLDIPAPSSLTFSGTDPLCSPSVHSLPMLPVSVDEKLVMPKEESEDDMPFWVREFEEGRLGITTNMDNFGDEAKVHDLAAKDAHTGTTMPASSLANKKTTEEKILSDSEPFTATIAERIDPVLMEEEKESVLAQILRKPAKAPLPSVELLEAAEITRSSATRQSLESKGKTLMTCLTDFGISCELVGITPGPVVTMFEVRPAPGVRVSRIANLSDDLALALKAVAVRIQAPVPGTDTVGIEIPNDVRETVCFKELIRSQLFQKSPSLLTLALGKDIAGEAAVADLATMPHLLVAGATGAGKSVGINSILLSFLFKARPDEVKLLLMDPKRVEMAIYADLPHLVHPVVTDMAMAKNALEWAVSEMERRYADIARAGVRNIGDYNAKLKTWGKAYPEGMEGLERMSYLVIVIDELADLMLVAAREVETSIVRLAQLARAAGIHLILATQRPSVDVVTGIIKANFPCRISFQVTSKHDSRTILDTVGAEHLLGKGDMLFKPGGGKSQRLHGAFVSDKNVSAICDYWRSRAKPEYMVDFAEWGQAEMHESGGFGGNDTVSDPLYQEACEFVRQQGKVSISLIQRRFRIGFNKAATFVEQMEQDGIIGPADGSKPRMVMK